MRGQGHERRTRIIARTVGYRTVMVLITMVVAFLVTDNVSNAVNIGLVTNVLKTATYYVYERLWSQITWGILDAG